MALATTVNGQDILDRKVSLDVRDAALSTALRELERSGQVKFSYNSRNLPLDETVTVRADNEILSSVLTRVLKPMNIKFMQVSNRIVLRREIALEKPDQSTASFSHILIQAPIDQTVTGIVTDETGGGLPGVSVLVKGTQRGTNTDQDGKYSVEVPDGSAVLVFSYVGYNPQEVLVGNRSSVNVSLKPDLKSLEEVVVVGYGLQKRRDIVGSIAKVSGEELNKLPTTSVAEALQGMASGLLIQNNSGHPGRGPDINIRGQGSINLGSSPLWIVDGVPIQTGSLDMTNNGVKPVSPLAMINPNDIESIEVLKDAAATAIYGNRGSNGVIIVTTKSAKSNKTGITLNYDKGISRLPFTQEDVFVNSKTWWELTDEAFANAGNTSVFEPERILSSQFLDDRPTMSREEAIATNTDHLAALTQNAGYNQVGVTANKGFDTGGIMFTMNYRDEKGMIRNNDLQRLTTRFNFNFSPVKSLNVGISTNFVYLKNKGVQTGNGKGLGGWANWFAAMPWYKIYDETSQTGYWGANSGFNALAFSDEKLIRNDVDQYRTISNAFIQWDLPIEGLRLRGEAGVDLLINNSSYWRSVFLDANAPFINEAAERSITKHVFNYNSYLNYDRTFGQHNVTATAGGEAIRQSSYTRQVEGTQIFSKYPELRNPLQITDGDGYRGGGQYLLGFFGRVNYKLKDRYLLNLSVRRDGHSVLSKANRWATFAAVGAGWIISDESFAKVPWLTHLKLRGSVGTTGNTGLSSEMTQINWGLSNSRYGGGYLPGGTTLGPIGNADLKWETTLNTDVGFDYGLFNNRLSGSVAYYVKKVSDLILRGNVPVSVGFTNNQVWENVGDLKNWGWEFSVNSVNINKNAFRWNTDFNFSFNDNRIIKLNQFEAGKGAESSQTIRKEGEKINSWYLAHSVGVDPQRGIIMIEQRDTEKWNNEFITVPNGNLIPGNTANTTANKMILHGRSTLPTFFGGITNRFTYKGIDLSMLIVYAGGNYLYNDFYGAATRLDGIYNIAQDIVGNYWQKPGDVAKFPMIVYGQTYKYDNDGNPSASGTRFETNQNDRYLEKANYARLRNVQIGYTLPNSLMTKAKLQNVRFYLSGTNLLTFTKFNGLDPETNNDLPVPRMLNLGVSVNL
ncbi:SusC/RagA family TonB-linked outer membrane protein [Persicitalea jodogahamensis]|uniref:SusC/RagA family TonB-linked outer membrane protein n=2 Tax=Persicitalea jodogahamensis TaxID=402147 RepID=A0A8J3GB52_9BACT|nr:SusC/RagA family TonB-linked outer membrane protein [Persicitalea jodogahamensis]